MEHLESATPGTAAHHTKTLLDQFATWYLAAPETTATRHSFTMFNSATPPAKLAISRVSVSASSAPLPSSGRSPTPQALLNSQSAAGLSFSNHALETSSYLISLSPTMLTWAPLQHLWWASTKELSCCVYYTHIRTSRHCSHLILQYSGKEGAAAAAFVAGLAAAGLRCSTPSVYNMRRP